MARITRDGVTFHPDQLDRKTGEPLEEGPAPAAELTPAQAAAAELRALGAENSGNWWALEINGEVHKSQGAEKSLKAFKAAGAA
jgi:hypothetical protein